VREKRISVRDPTWLRGFAASLDIQVKPPQTLEYARRHGCNVSAIRFFFVNFADVMDRAPELILNCDETHVSSRRKFKVLVPDGALPLQELEEKMPHFSAMCTISASGARFRPMIILPNLVKLPEDLFRYTSNVYFASTPTGWMTQPCFLIYAHYLFCELHAYIEELPDNLRGKPMLLILDGHPSRWSFEVMMVLRSAGLDVLVLPAHCTHLLQPFDVCVASPVKAALVLFLNNLEFTLAELREILRAQSEPRWFSEKRRKLIDAFINAWDRGASQRNIISGFQACGIHPLKPEIPINNPYPRRLGPSEIFQPPGQKPDDMNCSLVTGDDRLERLSRKPSLVFPDRSEPLVDQKGQWLELQSHPRPEGRILSLPGTGLLAKDGPELNLRRNPRKIYAHRRHHDTSTQDVWEITIKFARDLPIVFMCEDRDEAMRLHADFDVLGVEHKVRIAAGRNPAHVRTGIWDEWTRGLCRVALTTEISIMDLPWGTKAFTVYLHVPVVTTFLKRTQRGSALTFFDDARQLDQFKQGVAQNVRTVRVESPLSGTDP
jgi:hypothetical protein